MLGRVKCSGKKGAQRLTASEVLPLQGEIKEAQENECSTPYGI